MSTHPTLQSVALEQGRTGFFSPASPWTKPQIGKLTHSFDKVLPGEHILALYNGKTYTEAATLCQLRFGMCKLNKYLAGIGAIEADNCSCGRESESVDLFFFRCPLWLDQRRNICRLATKSNRWGDLSFALGGCSGVTKDGDRSKWRPSLEMVAATVKLALETKRLAEEQNDKEDVDRSDEGEEGSDNEKDDLAE